jgi:hypothetical protein
MAGVVSTADELWAAAGGAGRPSAEPPAADSAARRVARRGEGQGRSPTAVDQPVAPHVKRGTTEIGAQRGLAAGELAAVAVAAKRGSDARVGEGAAIGSGPEEIEGRLEKKSVVLGLHTGGGGVPQRGAHSARPPLGATSTGAGVPEARGVREKPAGAPRSLS